jgi:hypothetical protein
MRNGSETISSLPCHSKNAIPRTCNQGNTTSSPMMSYQLIHLATIQEFTSEALMRINLDICSIKIFLWIPKRGNLIHLDSLMRRQSMINIKSDYQIQNNPISAVFCLVLRVVVYLRSLAILFHFNIFLILLTITLKAH